MVAAAYIVASSIFLILLSMYCFSNYDDDSFDY